MSPGQGPHPLSVSHHTLWRGMPSGIGKLCSQAFRWIAYLSSQEVGRAGTFQFSRPNKNFCFVVPASVCSPLWLLRTQTSGHQLTSQTQLVSCWAHLPEAGPPGCFCPWVKAAWDQRAWVWGQPLGSATWLPCLAWQPGAPAARAPLREPRPPSTPRSRPSGWRWGRWPWKWNWGQPQGRGQEAISKSKGEETE